MRTSLALVAICFVVAGSAGAQAKSSEDRYERFTYRQGDKVKFRTPDGCQLERKWKRNGGYQEKIKCEPGRYGYGTR
jgi:hypothetical protein